MRSRGVIVQVPQPPSPCHKYASFHPTTAYHHTQTLTISPDRSVSIASNIVNSGRACVNVRPSSFSVLASDLCTVSRKRSSCLDRPHPMDLG